MRINDFDANVYCFELKRIKEQNTLDFKLWYRFDKLENKFSKTSAGVQGLIGKIYELTPDITQTDLLPRLIESIGDSSKEYTIEKIPFELLEGVKGNWSVLKALIDFPVEETEEVKEESETEK